MRRVAVFTEGQTEQVLVRHIVERVVDNSDLGFDCLRISGKRNERVRSKYGDTNRKIYILLINVGNDESVITAVRDRKQDLTKKGYEIIALRDIYSKKYLSYVKKGSRQPRHSVNQSIVNKMIHSMDEQFSKSTSGSQASLHFAVMEVEAWYLGMYKLLEEINPDLTIDSVKGKFGLNLRNLDPQSEFVHPSVVLDRILQLVGRKYKKSLNDAEKFAARVTLDHLQTATERGRCSHLKEFLVALLSSVGRYDLAQAFE